MTAIAEHIDRRDVTYSNIPALTELRIQRDPRLVALYDVTACENKKILIRIATRLCTMESVSMEADAPGRDDSEGQDWSHELDSLGILIVILRVACGYATTKV